MMRTFSVFLFCLHTLVHTFAQGAIVPNYGNAFDMFSATEHTQSVAVEGGYAVYNAFQVEGSTSTNALLIIDENGLIQTQVPITSDSTYYEPFLFSDGNTLYMVGYEAALPVSLDSADLAQRDYLIQSYRAANWLQEVVRTGVLEGEIGFSAFTRSFGVTIQSVYYKPIAQVAVVTEDAIVAISENLQILDDGSGGISDVGEGETVVTYFDRGTNALTRYAGEEENKLRQLADIIAVGEEIILYGFLGQTGNTVHTIGDAGQITSSDTDDDVFQGPAYAQYAVNLGEDVMVEAAAKTSGGVIAQMTGTIVSLRNADRELLLAKPEIPDEAPFGQTALTASADGAVFLATASLLEDRASFPLPCTK